MQLKTPFSVLIAPLDWGLGHATRCIPIIREFVQQGARVVIAASGRQKALLKLEFPQLEFLEIPGYGITYKQGILLKWLLVLSIPSILRKITRENRWLTETLRSQRIDAVISDNRYGLFHKNIYSVFITHQLAIQSGFGEGGEVGSWSRVVAGAIDSWVERKLLKWNYRFIEKFSACWVPDQRNDFSLAGKLSHPKKLPAIPTKYIGILSRFHFEAGKPGNNELLVLISGPEPQRTIFEKLLLKQLAGCAMKTVLVRGLPDSQETIHAGENVRICNHLPSHEMNVLLNESAYIIARSGYSTIMDLIKLRKAAILVPTPGQPEQEYLARHLHEKKWMYCVKQKAFNISEDLVGFQRSVLTLPNFQNIGFAGIISDLLESV
jgi:UDP:flavonoid glycosyltransferase YjiC (YdhE family)